MIETDLIQSYTELLFQLAKTSNDPDEIERLISEHNADYNAVDSDGNTPLHLAVMNGFVDNVKILLAYNSDNLEVSNSDGKHPLHIACELGSVEIVELLLQNGANIEKDLDGEMPLDIASKFGKTKVVKLLLQKADLYLESALISASRFGRFNVVKFLLKHGVDANSMEDGGDVETPLYVACENKHKKIIELLLENGADPNGMLLYDGNYIGKDALHLVCRRGDLEIATLLIKNGADIEYPEYSTYNTPFMIACKNHQDEIVKLLIKSGANINLVRKESTLWSMYSNYINKSFLLPIFKEAIKKEDVKVLKNLYKYECYQIILDDLYNDELKSLNAKPLFEYNLMKFKTIISTPASDSKVVGKMLKFFTVNKKKLYQEKSFHKSDLSDLIVSFLPMQKQWGFIRVLKKKLQKEKIFESFYDLEKLVKKLGVDVDIVPEVSLDGLQKVLKISNEDKQEILSKFPASILAAFSYPQVPELFAKHTNKINQFILLKLIAKTLSYKIDYYSEEDSIIHFSGGENPVAKFKIYQTSDGKQLISRQELVVESIDNAVVNSLDSHHSKKRLLEGAEQNLVVKIARTEEHLDVMEVEVKSEKLSEVLQGQGYSISLSLGHSSAENSFVQDFHNLNHGAQHLKFLELIIPKITIEGAVQESKTEILKIKLDQDLRNEQSNKAVFYGEIFYKATIILKIVDLGLDTFKVVYEPTFDNLNLLVQNAAHLGVILTGTSGYLPLVSAVDIAVQVYDGEYSKAMAQAGATILYMLLPTMLGTSLYPIYTGAILTYAGYKVVSKAYSIYSNYGTHETKLKSDLAYSELYDYLGLKDKVEEYHSNTKVDGAKNNESSIQYIAAEYNLLGEIYELSSDSSHCFV